MFETNQRPLQMVSEAEKVKNDFEWYKKSAKYFAGFSTNPILEPITSRQKEIASLYNWFNTYITPETFQEILKDGLYMGTELRPFSIIFPVLRQLLGEMRERKTVFQVEVINPDTVVTFLDKKFELFKRQLEELFVKTAQGEAPDDTEVQTKIEDWERSYRDKRAVDAQNLLKLILASNNFSEKELTALQDFIVVGEVFFYNRVRLNQVESEVVNPKEVHTFDRTVENVEDGEFFVREQSLPLGKVLEMFWEDMKLKDLKYLDSTLPKDFLTQYYNLDTQDWDLAKNVRVQHIVWKTFRKIGLLTYQSPLGTEEEMEVTEEYKVKDGEEVKWFWLPDVCEVYRVDKDIYPKMGYTNTSRKTFDLKKVKLPYSGGTYSTRNTKNISYLKVMLPYQILHIICLHQVESLLRKNLGKIILFDYYSIPNIKGWDTATFHEYIKQTSLFPVDRTTNSEVDKSFNQYTVLDASTLDQVKSLLELAQYLEEQCKQMVGFTKQRQGQTANSTFVGTVEKSIYQASLATEDMYARFEEYLRRQYVAILECSKIAFQDGFQALVDTDFGLQTLQIDPTVHSLADFNMFVTNAKSDKEALDKMLESAQAFAQNGYTPETVLDIVSSETVAGLYHQLRKAEKVKAKKDQEAAQQEQQNIQAQSEADKEAQALSNQFLMALETLKITGQKEIEMLKAGYQAEIVRFESDKNRPTTQPVDRTNEVKVADVAAKVYQADKQLEIAKQNKNKYDK